jgi:hypothetical protein
MLSFVPSNVLTLSAVGQISYHSAISGSKEYLPILASLIGPIGESKLAMLACSEIDHYRLRFDIDSTR